MVIQNHEIRLLQTFPARSESLIRHTTGLSRERGGKGFPDFARKGEERVVHISFLLREKIEVMKLTVLVRT